MRSTKPLKRSPLRRISPRQVLREFHLAELKRELIEERGEFCEAPNSILWSYRTGRYEIATLSPRCGWRADDAHHIVQRSLGGSDAKDNLLLLCRMHNTWVHQNIITATEMGLLKHAEPVRLVG